MHHEGMFLSLHHHFCIAAAAVRFTQDLLKFMSIQDRLAVAGYCLVAITIKVLWLSLSLMLYDMHTSTADVSFFCIIQLSSDVEAIMDAL